jgi:hypothetical protein
MAQGIIFAYSYNKFHATLTTRAQIRSAPTCVPETRFCCLKICGWDSGQPFVKSPGSSNTRPPCTCMKGKFPTPVNCLSGKFPGVSRGGDGYSGNWLMHNQAPRLCTIRHILYKHFRQKLRDNNFFRLLKQFQILVSLFTHLVDNNYELKHSLKFDNRP